MTAKPALRSAKCTFINDMFALRYVCTRARYSTSVTILCSISSRSLAIFSALLYLCSQCACERSRMGMRAEYTCVYMARQGPGRREGETMRSRSHNGRARCPGTQKVHCIYKSFIMNYTMVYLKWEACLVRGYMGYRDYNACGADGEQTGEPGVQEASEIRSATTGRYRV